MSTVVSVPAEVVPAPRSRRRWVLVGVVVVAIAVVGGAATIAGRSGTGDSSSSTTGTSGTALADVQRRSLSSQSQVNGTLGYSGDFDIVNQASGTVTSLPPVGQVMNQSDVLYRVNGLPVVLLYGATPVYRDLAAGPSASDVKGPDVQQLNAALVALGYDSSGALDPASDEFSWLTKAALTNLQAALGLDKTGALTLGQVVFLPKAARITKVNATLGAPAPPGTALLEATSTQPVVAVELEAARQSEVHTGDAVTITLPNLTTTAGTVASVGTVATTDDGSGDSGSGKAALHVEITLADPAAAGGLDQAPVLVPITSATAKDVLVVPVTALLALAGGGYAVEVADPSGTRHLVPVELGLFDNPEGLVQITGSGLEAGQRVVVPAT
jgi:Putative peptidoglycan binding domain